MNETFDKKEYAKKLSALTPGFSGADIANICNEAAIMAARADHESVNIRDFELATERVIGGIEKAMPITRKPMKIRPLKSNGKPMKIIANQ